MRRRARGGDSRVARGQPSYGWRAARVGVTGLAQNTEYRKSRCRTCRRPTVAIAALLPTAAQSRSAAAQAVTSSVTGDHGQRVVVASVRPALLPLLNRHRRHRFLQPPSQLPFASRVNPFVRRARGTPAAGAGGAARAQPRPVQTWRSRGAVRRSLEATALRWPTGALRSARRLVTMGPRGGPFSLWLWERAHLASPPIDGRALCRIARHIIGCQYSGEARVPNVVVDVANTGASTLLVWRLQGTCFASLADIARYEV